MKDVLKKGTLVHEETPFVQVLSSKLRFERCDHCYEKTEVQKCGGCRYVSYCDRTCQKAAWLDHRTECACLKRLPLHLELPNAARILARIILKLKRGGDMDKGWFSKSKFRLFKDLMSHYSDIKEDKTRLEHVISLSGVLMDYLGEDLINGAEIMGLYGRMIINSFNILDNEMNEIGTGIYLGASTIDHSCRPNAIAVFKGTTIFIRTIEDIPDYSWEKLRISYIDLLKSREERRADLLKQYFFLCECVRCSDEKQSEMEGAMLCQAPDCNAPIPSVTPLQEEKVACNECGEVVSESTLKKFADALEYTRVQHMNMKEIAYLDACRICLTKQEGLFDPMNIMRVKTLDLAFESAIKLGLWTDSIELGESLTPAYRKYMGKIHPLLGIHHLRLGKIYLYLDIVDKAMKELNEADVILRSTHGIYHPLYTQELLPLMLQAKYLVPPD